MNKNDARKIVTAWHAAIDGADAEHAVALATVAAHLEALPHGQAGPYGESIGLGRSETSRVRSIAKVATAAPADWDRDALAVETFRLAKRVTGVKVLLNALKSSEATTIARWAKVAEKANDAAKETRKAGGSTNQTERPSGTAKPNDQNARHGGTGDTSAVMNGDKGDTVTVAAVARHLAGMLDGKGDTGSLTLKDGDKRALLALMSTLDAVKASGALALESHSNV